MLMPELAGRTPGALQVVGEGRVFEAGNAVPAISGADQLLRDVAGQPVAGHALERGGKGLDQLPDGNARRRQDDPDGERPLGHQPGGGSEYAEVQRRAVNHRPRQHQLER